MVVLGASRKRFSAKNFSGYPTTGFVAAGREGEGGWRRQEGLGAQGVDLGASPRLLGARSWSPPTTANQLILSEHCASRCWLVPPPKSTLKGIQNVDGGANPGSLSVGGCRIT